MLFFFNSCLTLFNLESECISFCSLVVNEGTDANLDNPFEIIFSFDSLPFPSFICRFPVNFLICAVLCERFCTLGDSSIASFSLYFSISNGSSVSYRYFMLPANKFYIIITHN